MRKARKEFLNLVEEEKREVYQLLDSKGIRQDIEFLDHTYVIYEIDMETMRYLARREEEFGKMVSSSIGVKTKNPYYLISKLINKDRPAPKYAIIPTKKYIYVKDKEKILRDMDALFSIWKNSKMKQLSRYVREHNLKEEEELELREKFLAEIGKGYLEMEYIKENADNLELLRTNYKNARYYLALQYRDVKSGEFITTHMRKEVPNVIALEKIEIPKKERRDKKIEKFLSEAKHAFEFIYYKEKE